MNPILGMMLLALLLGLTVFAIMALVISIQSPDQLASFKRLFDWPLTRTNARSSKRGKLQDPFSAKVTSENKD